MLYIMKAGPFHGTYTHTHIQYEGAVLSTEVRDSTHKALVCRVGIRVSHMGRDIKKFWYFVHYGLFALILVFRKYCIKISHWLLHFWYPLEFTAKVKVNTCCPPHPHPGPGTR